MTGLPTRALSLSWPWPYYMLSIPEEFRKKVENRKLGFSHKSFRGECWVHCTKPKTERAYLDALLFARQYGVPDELCPSFRSPWIGCIVGRWTVVDVLPPPLRRELPDRWRMMDQFGFVVENAHPVTPVACKGALGFWTVPEPILDELRRNAK